MRSSTGLESELKKLYIDRSARTHGNEERARGFSGAKCARTVGTWPLHALGPVRTRVAVRGLPGDELMATVDVLVPLQGHPRLAAEAGNRPHHARAGRPDPQPSPPRVPGPAIHSQSAWTPPSVREAASVAAMSCVPMTPS